MTADLFPATWGASVPLTRNTADRFGADLLGLGTTVTRDQAMAVPSVARARGIITGSVAQLPLKLHRDGRPAGPDDLRPWVASPDPSLARVATIAWTVDDLLFHGWSWWQVTALYAEDGRPRTFRRVMPHRVAPKLSTDGQRVVGWTLDGTPAPPQGLGRLVAFQATEEGVLARGALTIRTALELERAAYRYAEQPAPSAVLKNNGADMPPAKRDELMAAWKAARRAGSVAYLSAALELQEQGWDPAQLQLVEARRHVAAEVARLMGVPALYLAADQGAGSSMTYSNLTDERRTLVDATLRPYLDAIAQRLSMPDVLPSGLQVQFDLEGFLRADHATLAAYYGQLLQAGVVTVDEVRDRLGFVTDQEATT